MNFEPLKEFMDNYLAMLGVPGSDISIYRNHEEIFRYQSGFDNLELGTPVRSDALYHIFSCTKVSTCVAATQLIERGEILASDPVYAYLPEYRNITVKHARPDGSFDVRPAKNVLTIKHLLTMTGGLDYDTQRPALLRAIEETGGRAPTIEIANALARDPLNFEPGTKYMYSLGLDVMGAIIEIVSGMSLEDYMQENIFKPLGMKDTSFLKNDERIARLATQYEFNAETGTPVEIQKDSNWLVFGTEFYSGGAGLISSVEDYVLLADALSHYGVGKTGNRILSRYGVELMRTNQFSDELLKEYATNNHLSGYGYGYGVRTNMNPGAHGNLSPVGEFGWDGARGAYFSSDPTNKISFFYAQHMGGLSAIINPKLRNVVYSCIGE